MKIKKILLGGLVLVFAIGSAIASVLVPEQAHVRGKVSINPAIWNCVPVRVTCDTQGPAECVVRIPVLGVNTNVLAYKGPGYCAPETSCIVPLRRSTSTPIAGIPIKTIYEIRPTDAR